MGGIRVYAFVKIVLKLIYKCEDVDCIHSA